MSFLICIEFSNLLFSLPSVERKSHQFGEVRVYWQVVRLLSDGSVSELSPGQEFANVIGFVTFPNGDASQSITLTPLQDGIAELDESFELRLINATGKLKTFYRSQLDVSFCMCTVFCENEPS